VTALVVLVAVSDRAPSGWLARPATPTSTDALAVLFTFRTSRPLRHAAGHRVLIARCLPPITPAGYHEMQGRRA
jgi:hypothetical protein